MVWYAFVIISLAFNVISSLLNRGAKAKPEDVPKFPENDGSRPVPVVFGECLIQNPFLMDYFDFKTEAIKQFAGWVGAVSPLLGMTNQTIGYRYRVGMIFGLCWGKGNLTNNHAIQLREILIDNRVIYSDTGQDYNNGRLRVTLNKPDYFGNPKREGGIQTVLDFVYGMDTDPVPANTYWETQRGLTMPTYKDVAHVIWYGPSSGFTVGGKRSGYVGNSPALWPIAFKVRRQPQRLGSIGIARLGDYPGAPNEQCPHANPIECLYEVLIDPDYGADFVPNQEIDFVSFESAASQVFSEGLGFSYLWTQGTALEMVNEILRYVDASLYTDLQSGKIKINLIRPANLSSVPSYSKSDFLEVQSFKRGSWEDTKNEIKLVFPDHSRLGFEDNSVTYFDPANFNIQGPSSEEIRFNGCPSARLALRLAAREGKVLSTPIAQLTAKIDRKAWNVFPGMSFKYSDPDQGISNLPMRLANIKLGTVKDGSITIYAVEDVFSAGSAVYGAPSGTVWTDPLEAQALDAAAAVAELPYFLQKDGTPRLFSVVARPNDAHLSYDGLLDGADVSFESDFTPSGLLVSTLPQTSQGDYDTTGFLIEDFTDGDGIEAGTLAEIQRGEFGLGILGDPGGTHEIFGFTATATESGNLRIDNVYRGLLDTPPREWPAGTRVWFIAAASSLLNVPLTDGQNVTFEALTRTMRDRLVQTEASNIAYQIKSRALRPLPPYFVRLNGEYDKEQWETGDGDLVFSWREFSRLSMSQIIRQDTATAAAEAGVTYEVDVLGDAGTIEGTYTGLSTPDFTYTPSDQTVDFGTAQAELTFRFYARRDGLRSLLPWERKVYGFTTGAGPILAGSEPVYVGTDPVFSA